MPTLLPNGGTTFNVSGQKGSKSAIQVTAVPTSGSISIELDNGSAALIPKSVKVRVPVKYMGYSGEVELARVKRTEPARICSAKPSVKSVFKTDPIIMSDQEAAAELSR